MHPHTTTIVYAVAALTATATLQLAPQQAAAGDPPPVIRKMTFAPKSTTADPPALAPLKTATPSDDSLDRYVDYGPPQAVAPLQTATGTPNTGLLPTGGTGSAAVPGVVVSASTTQPDAVVLPASSDQPTSYEHDLLDVAIHHCDNARPHHAKPKLMLKLLRLEEAAGLPEEMRGVTLAAWCGEAAYGVENIVGDGGRAEGILQMHSMITRLCGPLELRNDPIQTTECWLWNLKRIRKKSLKRCGKRRSWKAAELWLSQGGKKSKYSCKNVSGHVARLERWQSELRRRERRGLRYATFHERFVRKARDLRPFPPALPGRRKSRTADSGYP